MNIDLEIDGVPHTIALSEGNEKFAGTIDGIPMDADAVEIAPGVYSILIDGRSFEVCIAPLGGELRMSVGWAEYVVRVRDPRKWERNRDATASSQGLQSVAAPMPGRVVRILAKPGDPLSAGQGIVVVEAMKMQNEVRSPKEGRVERILVKEGQPVNAGDTIAVVA
jgi:acetyl/propionyl-CoA carboxylase alpha subunit